MSDVYYNNELERAGAKPRRSLVGRIFDLLLTLLSVAVAAALALTYAVPYFNPATVWFFPVLGLAAPGIYLAAVALMLYWIIRWRWLRAGTMMALVVVGLFKVSLFWRPELRRTYGEPDYDRNALKVMTYNVRGFYAEDGRSSVDSVMRLIETENPDIVCLQEFNARLAERSEAFERLDDRYERALYDDPDDADSPWSPLVVLSKYRILRSGVILTPASSVWADLLVDGDTVRVFNNHLHSTAINADDNEFITSHRYLSDSARETKIRSIVARLRENSVLRAEEVDSIARVKAETTTPIIVCGDFNDTPMSYVYREMAQGLSDAFSESGSGYSHTYRGFFNTLRIDYVLSSEEWEAVSYETLPVEYSDHHPVVVRLERR